MDTEGRQSPRIVEESSTSMDTTPTSSPSKSPGKLDVPRSPRSAPNSPVQESDWLDVHLNEQGDNVDLSDIGLKITHEGGGHKTVRRGSISRKEKDFDRTDNLSYLIIAATLLGDEQFTNKYQLFASDKTETALVLDTKDWESPINSTYKVKLQKCGKDGSGAHLKIRRTVPKPIDTQSQLIDLKE